MAEPLVSDDGCMAGSKDVSRLYERIADVGAHWDFNAGPGNHYHCSSPPILKPSSAGIWGILVNGWWYKSFGTKRMVKSETGEGGLSYCLILRLNQV